MYSSGSLLLLLLCGIYVWAAPVYDEYNQLNLSASCPTVACSLQNLEQPLRLVGNSTELPQLQQLLLGDSRIRTMPVELLRRTPNLRMLLMQNSSVYLMQKEDFQGIPQLQQLQMQRTHLARLREQQFAALPQLEVLQLNHNMIQFVHPAAFVGLLRLQLLALRGNGIVELPAGTFDPLVNLTHLDLGHNEISQLDAKTFAGNLKLQTLLLNDNKLLQFESQSLLALTQLHLLDLSRAGRQLEEVQLYGAQRVQLKECGLRRLIITSSVISLKAANNELTELSVGDKRSPIELDLHGNQLSGNASASLLQGMWNLQHLDLSKNNIESLSSLSQSLSLLLPSLVQLNLAHNQLRGLSLLPSGLIELDISFNHMLSVRSEHFAALPNLQRLYMDGMRLGQLDYRVFHTQHSMLHVLGICDQDAALMRKLVIYFKDRAVQLPVSCLHSVSKAATHTEQEEEQEQELAEPKAQAQRTDLAGICGIHPYWTLRDTLTFATLLVVMCILLMQFYNILEEEGCLRRLRDWCSGRSRRRQPGTVGNGHRNRRLNEEDSESSSD